MNEWLEDILDKPRGQRIVYLLAACLAVWALMWVFLVGGRWRRANAVGVEIRAQRERLAKLEKKANNLDEVSASVGKLDRELREALESLPNRREIPQLLNNISELASAAGLRITKFRQRGEVLRDYYAEVPVELSMRGSFHQIASFFDRVPRLNRLINVTDISMKRPAVVDDTVQVEAACLVTTFRFLDEEERERAAKEREKKPKGGKHI